MQSCLVNSRVPAGETLKRFLTGPGKNVRQVSRTGHYNVLSKAISVCQR